MFDGELKKHLLWSDKNTKLLLYEALVVSLFMYRAECWTLKREDERRILAAEINSLRRLFGVSNLEKSRNEEIRQELGQMITLVGRIHKQRLQWLGRVERTHNDRFSIRALHRRTEGTESQGRQRKRWIDNVKEMYKRSKQHTKST